MKKNELLFFSLVLTAAIFSPLSVLGLEIHVVDQDPAGKVRSNALTATVDNPTAIYFNPLGMTELEGNNVGVGLALEYEHWRRDVACQLDYSRAWNITGGTPNLLTGESADSRYEYISHELTFTV